MHPHVRTGPKECKQVRVQKLAKIWPKAICMYRKVPLFPSEAAAGDAAAACHLAINTPPLWINVRVDIRFWSFKSNRNSNENENKNATGEDTYAGALRAPRAGSPACVFVFVFV